MVVLIILLQFHWNTEAVTSDRLPEYCFDGNETSSHLQPIKNSSWKTTSAAELLYYMFQCYDSRVRVENIKDSKPTDVIVSLYLLSIGNFKVRQMDFQLSFYYREIWRDPRLAYGNHFPKDEIELGGEIRQNIWVPNTYFVNKKGSASPADAQYFVRISRNGTLSTTTKNTITMDCYMDLRNFPFDVQKCNLNIESFGFAADKVVYKWISQDSSEAVEKDPGMMISEFDLGSIRTFETTSYYKLGPFSNLRMELTFFRKSVYYLIQIYIPSGMIVALSWVSFWIDNQSIPARTALGITTVLAMTTLLFGIQSSLPSVPYIKAVDLFMIVSFASVFAALIEFAVVNYTSMREKEKRKIRPAKNTYHVNPDILMLSFRNRSFESDDENKNNLQNGSVHTESTSANSSLNRSNRTPITNGTASAEYHPRDQTVLSRDYPHVQETYSDRPRCRWHCKVTANAIDAWSRVLFPLSYGLFIVAYWIIYSSSSQAEKN
ncbi:hypothetical protein ABFA07_016952 [Porites harrisoni]